MSFLPKYIRRRYAPSELRVRPRHLNSSEPYAILDSEDTVIAGPYSDRAVAVEAKKDLIAGRVVPAAH